MFYPLTHFPAHAITKFSPIPVPNPAYKPVDFPLAVLSCGTTEVTP
jgi:hypothetical protein